MSSEHAIDALSDGDLAERMRVWAESLEAQIVEGKVVEIASTADSADSQQ
jgi:hypothetical protein